MKNLRQVFVLPCLLLGLSTLSVASNLKPETQGSVTFVSGGIGTDERAELKAMRASYNLSLMFSQKGGEFLSDVKVRITDANNKTVLETVATGPQLLVKLPAGPYSITAEFGGKRLDKKASLGDKPLPTLSFVWP